MTAAEVRELPNILQPGEVIAAMSGGRYENGFALLVATDRRLLLVDKKLLFFTVEDIRYDMIAEIDYSSQVFLACISIVTFNKTLKFTSLKPARLRAMTDFVQTRVMELRQHQYTTPGSRSVSSPIYGLQDQLDANQFSNVRYAREGREHVRKIGRLISKVSGLTPVLMRPIVPNPYVKSPLTYRRYNFRQPRTS